MATQTTRWSPDTCGCVVEYTWEDSVPAASRVHTPATVVQRCAAHVALSDAEVHSDLNEENPRKNKAEARLLAAFPAKLGVTVTDPDTGGVTTRLKANAYTYRFLSGGRPRTIELALPLLSGAERNAVQTWCDANLGAGRVVVVP